MIPNIARKPNIRKLNVGFCHHLYGLSYVVENAVARLKHFTGIHTRFENQLAITSQYYSWLAHLFDVNPGESRPWVLVNT